MSGYAGGWRREVDAGVASTIENPPNPNIGLYQFAGKDLVTGAPTLDAASWVSLLQFGAS